MNELKLLPCPFCGSEAFPGWFGDYEYNVGCSGNECEAGNFSTTIVGMTPEQEAAAIAKCNALWNTRVPSPAVVELVRAAHGMKRAYEALLAMKAEDPTRFKEPGSRYHALSVALAPFSEIEKEE